MQRLPRSKRRRMEAVLGNMESRIWDYEQVLEGTPDDDGDETARDYMVGARMALGEARAALLRED